MLSFSRLLLQKHRTIFSTFKTLRKFSTRESNEGTSFRSPSANPSLEPEDQEKSLLRSRFKDLQQRYLNDERNTEVVFEYIKALNKLEKYHDVIWIYEKHRLGSGQRHFPYVWRHDEIDDIYNQAKLRTQIEVVVQRREKKSFGYYFRLSILAYLFYLLVWQQIDDGMELRKNKNGGNKKGILDSFMGKTSDGETGEHNISTRFTDVLGIDEFKEELQEIVDYLKNPQKYQEAGAKIPKGILLVGPPGTGKTLLARALAGEANCTFFYKSGSEFDEIFVGMGARRVRDMFKKARKAGTAIIFIDEIDSLAGRRSVKAGTHSRDTINQILAEMDGFTPSDNIIVIGATNLEEALDEAVKRPGRFDKTIHIPFPDVKGREEIFNYYLQKIKAEPDIDAHILAKRTMRFTGADIQNMVNLAILNAVKDGRNKASNHDFEYAYDRMLMGVGRKNLVMTDKEKLLTAYHEGGHALVSLLSKGADPLHKVTILPRGGALGFTAMIPEDELSQSRKNMLARIDVCMGGRAAEELIFGKQSVTSGCSSDLKGATQMAYHYVRDAGMMDKFTLISAKNKMTSDEYNYYVDKEVQSLLKKSLDKVKLLLQDNRHLLEKLAHELLKKETMTMSEVKELLKLS